MTTRSSTIGILLLVPSVVLAPVAHASPAQATVVFDRTSAGGEAPPPGRGKRALIARHLAPRLGSTVPDGPVAWGLREEGVELDAALSASLAGGLSRLPVERRAAERLLSRARQAGEPLPLLPADEAANWLSLQPGGIVDVAAIPAATVRVLTRGNVRDLWSVREEILRPDPELPAPALPAPRLLVLDVVSLGLHLGSDDGSLPERFAHLGLRARLWDLRTGHREWDRALLIGSVIGDEVELVSGYPAVLEALIEAGVDRLAAELWPELELPSDDAATAMGPSSGEAVAAERGREAHGDDAEETASPDGASLEELLQRLARLRLSQPPEGEAWPALARAVKPVVSEALALALACAEDPLGVVVETGSRRLGLGLADTLRRVESSEALRLALAEDLAEQVAEAAGPDWPLEGAVRHLLGRSMGSEVAPASEAARVAEPLLRSARLDGAGSAESLGALLLSARIWPDGTRATLAEILER